MLRCNAEARAACPDARYCEPGAVYCEGSECDAFNTAVAEELAQLETELSEAIDRAFAVKEVRI